MNLVVRAFPLLDGQEPALREMATSMQTGRAAEAAEFYGRHGVARETWFLQETDHGSWVIAVTQIDDRPVEAAAKGYAESLHEFDVWLKNQVLRLTGVDPNVTPLGPPTTCVFDTDVARGFVAGTGD